MTIYEPNAIICYICGEPITGVDVDHRFWLHEIGCAVQATGECECDLECHAGCYAGHEAEYMLFCDDKEDNKFSQENP